MECFESVLISQPGWMKWKPLLVHLCVNSEQCVFMFPINLVQFCKFFSEDTYLRVRLNYSPWQIVFNCISGEME